MCGNSSLTQIPLLPNCENRQGLGMIPPTSSNIVGRTSTGMGLPASRSRRGLGSNESTWDTPPDMKQKMTLLALGAKLGRFPPTSCAAGAGGIRDASATEPKPVEHCDSIRRRERRLLVPGRAGIEVT